MLTKQPQNMIELDFAEEMKNSYRDYAMSVIIERALPDIRDGLKPVQRRILFAMNELGLDPKKPHRKSARIVGDTMGKYHPHGDSSIYDALVHLAEDYSLSIPLVDGHGNFGSIDGDRPAAMRYTEARLSEGAMTLLHNLDKDLVEFMPNFDNSEKEPMVLPASIPNLLINGTTGIAVGMTTSIPPHNPGEIIDGVISYMDVPNITNEQLMLCIPGPDFPTGGIITNPDDIPAIYTSGEGRLRIRAKCEIEDSDYGRKNIIITEIPYTMAGNKTKLVESLVSMMKDKVFDEIYDVRDESSKEGIRIVIEVKKDRDIENLLNGLYKKTPLEDTLSINLLAIKEKQPIVFDLKSMIGEFVTFQEELYTKEYHHLLKKAENRLEIVNGLIKATDVIDLIIEILRGSNTIAQTKNCLIHGDISEITLKSAASKKKASKLNFTERQADAILAMPLSRLIGLEILKLHEESETLLKSIEDYEKILHNKKELHKVIKKRLKEYKKQFSRPRRTRLMTMTNQDYIEEFKEEDLVILIDKFGYTKCIDSNSYSRMSEENQKEFQHIISMKNTDKLCLFTMQGNMYQIKASAIPRCRARDKGVLLQSLCKLGQEEIILYTNFETLFESQLLFVTEHGYIKKVSGAEFESVRSVIASTKLEKEDKLAGLVMLSAKETLENNHKIILITKKKLTLGFSLEEVPEMKKNGRGVKAIQLNDGDIINFAICVPLTQESFLFHEKKYPVKKIKMRKRGAKGEKTSL